MDSIFVIQTALTGVFLLFQDLINTFPVEWGLYFSIVLMVMIFRFIIFPAFGVTSSSDTAKKGKNRSSGKKAGKKGG